LHSSKAQEQSMPLPYLPHFYIYGGGPLFWFPDALPFDPPLENDRKEQSIAMTSSALDNPIWSALTSRQAHLAIGGKLAKRYPKDMAAIAAVASSEPAAFAELATLIAAGEAVYLAGTELSHIVSQLPSSLRVKHQTSTIQMVYSRPARAPENNKDISTLSEADLPEILELISLARPGPFLARTYQLGKYLGFRHRGQLVAMAGERMSLDGYREISTICTHPDFQGRGYAGQLVSRLVNINLSEGNTPFLHVMHENERARSIYKSLGFVERRRMPLVVVQRADGVSNC
jgi:predicted GNAT family acetyltransferase